MERNKQKLESTKTITKEAFLWLAGAGIFAVCLASTLLYVDNRLSSSPAEQEKNVMLQRARSAQAELSVGSVDPRQGATSMVARRLSELEKE